MSHANYYKQGSFNIICSQCGQKYKDSECSQRWDGVVVCKNCYERKHPFLEPVPSPIDSLPVDRAQTRPTERFIDYGYNYNKWNYIISSPAVNGRVKWNNAHFKWNVNTSSDTPDTYLFPVSGE